MQSNTNYELSVGACCENLDAHCPIEFRDMGTFQHTPAVLIAIVITENLVCIRLNVITYICLSYGSAIPKFPCFVCSSNFLVTLRFLLGGPFALR